MVWGPVIPGVLWARNRGRSESLALCYARRSTVVWSVLVGAYSLLLGWGLFIPSVVRRAGDTPVDPEPLFWIVVGLILATMMVTAIVGSVVALRADVAGGRGTPIRALVRGWRRR